MALKKMLIFLFLAQTAQAINLGFFGIQYRNASTPRDPIPVSEDLDSDFTTESRKYQTNQITVTTMKNAEKLEFEEENPKEPEPSSAECNSEDRNCSKPFVPVGGQEIDETKKIVDAISALLPVMSTIKLPEIPSFTFPKRKTISVTSTAIVKVTKRKIVFPSCLALNNIRSICDGSLITIQPTPAVWSDLESTKAGEEDNQNNGFYDQSDNEAEEIAEMEEVEEARHLIQPTASIPHIQSTKSHLEPVERMIEPSELDQDHEYVHEKFKFSTPGFDSSQKKLIEHPRFPEILIGQPVTETITELFRVTQYEKMTNYKATATVVAVNCLPPNIALPYCERATLHPTIIYSTSQYENQEAEENKVHNFDGMQDQLNKFVLSNPHGFLGINPEHAFGLGYGAVDINGNSNLEPVAMERSINGRSLKVSLQNDANIADTKNDTDHMPL